jgi:hypothetical protein
MPLYSENVLRPRTEFEKQHPISSHSFTLSFFLASRTAAHSTPPEKVVRNPFTFSLYLELRYGVPRTNQSRSSVENGLAPFQRRLDLALWRTSIRQNKEIRGGNKDGSRWCYEPEKSVLCSARAGTALSSMTDENGRSVRIRRILPTLPKVRQVDIPSHLYQPPRTDMLVQSTDQPT